MADPSLAFESFNTALSRSRYPLHNASCFLLRTICSRTALFNRRVIPPLPLSNTRSYKSLYAARPFPSSAEHSQLTTGDLQICFQNYSWGSLVRRTRELVQLSLRNSRKCCTKPENPKAKGHCCCLMNIVWPKTKRQCWKPIANDLDSISSACGMFPLEASQSKFTSQTIEYETSVYSTILTWNS